MMPKWLRLLSGVQTELFPGRLFEDKEDGLEMKSGSGIYFLVSFYLSD